MFQSVLDGFKQLVFPDNCFLCKIFLNSRHTRQLCGSCLSKVPLNTPPFCLKCGRHINQFSPESICPSCVKTSYAFDRAWGVCLYKDETVNLLHAFKYKGKTGLKRTFAGLMNDFIHTYHIPMGDFDAIIPMPLHGTRVRERGFNQSELLSEELSKRHNLPVMKNILTRVRYTETQTALEAKQRWTNLDRAFKINHSSAVAEKEILLVDDLLTTGASAHFAALCLKEAGCSKVSVLTLAVA